MRSLSFLLCLAAGFTIHAQDTGFISGNVSFATTKIDAEGTLFDEQLTTGSFGPAIGYNLSPTHVVGIALGISSSTRDYSVMPSETQLDATEKRSMVTIAPFYRYMKSVNDRFLLYGQAKVGFGFGKETSEVAGVNSQQEVDLSALDLRIGPGLVYVVADRWALSADWGVLGHVSEKRTMAVMSGDVEYTTSGFEASLNPGAITIALNWLF